MPHQVEQRLLAELAQRDAQYARNVRLFSAALVSIGSQIDRLAEHLCGNGDPMVVEFLQAISGEIASLVNNYELTTLIGFRAAESDDAIGDGST